jgi:AraC-like DNA-binding protein
MRLSTAVNLNKEPFHLNFQKTSDQKNWEVFHAHQSMEFLYVYEGEGSAHVNKSVIPIVPGSLLIFQPFQLHRLKIKQNFVRSVFMFEPYAVDSSLIAFPSLRKFYDSLWKSLLSNQAIYLSPEHNEFILLYHQLNERLKTVPSGKWQEEFILFIMSFLQHLRFYVKDLCPPQYTAPSLKGSHTVDRMIRWIDTNFRNNFTLKKMSEELHLSTYYLSHTFREATGSSITEFITSRRLKEACILLETSSMSISHIALEVGFQNGSYFCRVFKQKLQLSPKDYRQSCNL